MPAKRLLHKDDTTWIAKKNQLLYLLLLFFFLTLYTPVMPALNNAAMWMLFVFSFFHTNLKARRDMLFQRKELLLISLFVAWSLLSLVWSANQKEFISWTGIRLAVPVFAFTLGTISLGTKLRRKVLKAFVWVTSLAATGALAWGITRYFQFHQKSLLYNDSLSEVLNLQSIYFAMLINLSIYSLVYLFLTKKAGEKRNNLLIVLPILLLVHFLLASRMAIIILYGSGLVFGLIFIFHRKKYLEGALLVTGLLIGGFLLLKMFPKTVNRFRELNYTQFNYRSMAVESHYNMVVTADQWNGANIRLAVWQCGWAAIRQNWLWGVGLGDKMDELRKQYASRGFQFAIQTNRNMHNNYLDIWLSLGILGLLLFLGGFVLLPIAGSLQAGDWYGAIIVLSLAAALLTENYMDRTMGNTILGFFIAFVVAGRKPRPTERKVEDRHAFETNL